MGKRILDKEMDEPMTIAMVVRDSVFERRGNSADIRDYILFVIDAGLSFICENTVTKGVIVPSSYNRVDGTYGVGDRTDITMVFADGSELLGETFYDETSRRDEVGELSIDSWLFVTKKSVRIAKCAP